MAKRSKKSGFKFDLTQIIVAIIAAASIIIGAYWQFVWKPSQELPHQMVEYVGRVTDINTGKPIKGAEVTLDFEGVPPIVYTDSVGVYRFKVDIDGNTTGRVRITASGYKDYDRIITLIPSNSSIDEIKLAPN